MWQRSSVSLSRLSQIRANMRLPEVFFHMHLWGATSQEFLFPTRFSISSRSSSRTVSYTHLDVYKIQKVFPPDTILSPDSFPFVSLPTDHQLERPDILRSEILDQSINLMTIIHIFCYNCCNLIFLLSWCHSPFIYHFRRDALNQAPFEKFFLRQSTTGYTLQTFSLSAIYRCVARSCHKVIKQNPYQRKSSCIPHLSKYSCLAFSRSSSVDAVLNVVYNLSLIHIFCIRLTRNTCHLILHLQFFRHAVPFFHLLH